MASAVTPASPPCAIPWSSSDSASRTEPSATRAISASASGSAVDPFGRANLTQMADHRARLDAPQIEANAARAHGDRHLFDFGGRKQKLDVLRRLFKRLQKTVEGLLREHVHFVDDVDLGARRNRAIARVLDDLAHVVDAGVGGRVHLDHVDMARFHDRLAVEAEFGHLDARARRFCRARHN